MAFERIREESPLRVKQNVLSRLPLFSGLNKEEIRLLAEQVEAIDLQDGEVLYNQGDVVPALFILREGRGLMLHVGEDGLERRVDDFTANEYIGQRSLFLTEPRDVTVLMVRPSEVFMLDKVKFDKVCLEHPEIREKMLRQDELREIRRYLEESRQFDWLRDNEYVVMHERRDRYYLLKRMGWALLLFPLLLAPALFLGALPVVQVILLAIAFLVPLGITTFFYLDWRNDYFVVTNQRVVHEENVLLTMRETREQAPLSTVTNVNINQEGFFESQLNFGDVVINTASPMGTIVFDYVHKLQEFREAILQHSQKLREVSSAQRRGDIMEEIDERIGAPALRREPIGQEKFEEIQQEVGPVELPDEKPRSRHDTFWWLPWKLLLRIFTPPLRFEDGDRITYRKHWFVLWQRVLGPVMAFVLVLGVGAWRLTDTWPLNMISPALSLIVFIALVGLTSVWYLWEYDDWRNELFVVTRSSIEAVHQRPLWMETERKYAQLDDIENVNTQIRRVWGHIFNYGTVTIQTAGEQGSLVFNNVHNPHAVTEDILQRQLTIQQQEELDENEQLRETLGEWFAIYHQAANPEDNTAYAWAPNSRNRKQLLEEDQDQQDEEGQEELKPRRSKSGPDPFPYTPPNPMY